MLRTVSGPWTNPQAQRLVRILDGPRDVRDDWLANTGSVAVIDVSGRSPDPDQTPLLAAAFASVGVDKVIGVPTEDLGGTEVAYVLETSSDDLDAFSYARAGLEYALLPLHDERCVVLCSSVGDYILVAGQPVFVATYAADPAAMSLAFRDYVHGDPVWDMPGRVRVLRHLDHLDLLATEAGNDP